MNPRRKRRLIMVLVLVMGIGGATALALVAFRENLLYFNSPSDVAAGKAPKDRLFRLGGMVKEGSVQRSDDGLSVTFVLTDYASDITVRYSGILPDLFREGQGIVANGKLGPDGVFVANEVLAKHDENYMPPEVAESLQMPPTEKMRREGAAR